MTFQRRFAVIATGLLTMLVVACSGGAAPTEEVVPTVESDTVKSPNFSYIATDGREISLSRLTEENEAVVLVFYRGFF